LLDTLLMNMSELHVLEEQPVLRQVQVTLGDEARLATLSSAEANALRAHYFETLEQIQPAPPGRTVIDKFPLHMTDVPLIHRLFPDAKVILVERQPLRFGAELLHVQLSAQPRHAKLHRPEGSRAHLRCRVRKMVSRHLAASDRLSPYPLRAHGRGPRVRNASAARVSRPCRGIRRCWTTGAVPPSAIISAPPAIPQVTEPIYRRSAGRWQRYRRQMESILPILEPWAQRMGYEM
jgi:hypothetical protein